MYNPNLYLYLYLYYYLIRIRMRMRMRYINIYIIIKTAEFFAKGNCFLHKKARSTKKNKIRVGLIYSMFGDNFVAATFIKKINIVSIFSLEQPKTQLS